MKKEEARARSNTALALRTLKKVLTEIEWVPKSTGDQGCFVIDLGEPAGGDPDMPLSHALVALRPGSERFLFYLCFRDNAAKKDRDKVAEFIVRANYGLVIGNFEMRYKDGSVRFKSSVDFTRVELSESWVQNAILSAMEVVQIYGGPLREVMAGKMSVQKALGDDWEA